MAKDTFFYPKATINCRGRLLDLTNPKVMGIVNLTPDSFYDGGTHGTNKHILNRIETMLENGADIIDIGGYSSRPGAKHIEPKEEIKRVIPTIKQIAKTFPNAILSIDTFRSLVAEQALDSGASIVNDISAGEMDPEMPVLIAKEKIPYIIMHMQGAPQTMQLDPVYENVTNDILSYFYTKIKKMQETGINDLIIDPGFGFGKTLNHNYELLHNLQEFMQLKKPVLVGLSRKSMIYKKLNINPNEALNGTTALNMFSLLNGANILRVHDVKQAKETIDLFTALNL